MSDSTELLVQAVRMLPGTANNSGAGMPGVDGLVDIRIVNDAIAEVGAGLQPSTGAQVIPGNGALVLPGLVDGHGHIDKTLWGRGWHSHGAGPSVADRIEYETRTLRQLAQDTERESSALLRHMIARGSTHLRTHVDVTPELGLSHFEATQRVREQFSAYMDMQVVAFPQVGVTRAPGTAELLDAALAQGAEVLGGIDPIGIDQDPKGQLDILFELCERHGCELDIHLHDRGEVGAISVELIADRCRALGMQGKIVISHAFCLGSVDSDRRAALLALLIEQDIAVMSHGPSGGTPFPPLRELQAAGVRLFSGSDGIRDTWGPLNTGDMLERAFLVAYVNGFRDDDGLELALHMCTHGGAGIMGATGYGLEPGCQADLVLVEAENGPHAVIAHGPRKLVLKRGRVVARDDSCLV